MKPLIICAHYDDEVIGCSSILQLNPVVLVVCGHNNRREQSYKIEQDLGIKYIRMDYEYFELKNLNQDVLIDSIKNKLRFDFDCVFTHSTKDLHSDHKMISNAVDVITRTNRSSIRMLCHFYTEHDLDYNYFIKLDYKHKLKMLDYYKDIINADHLSTIISNNNHYGIKNKLEFCEPFEMKYMKVYGN